MNYTSFEKLVDMTKNLGIMLTVRYVTEWDKWALIYHHEKTVNVSAEAPSLEEACEIVLKKLKSS